MSPELMVMIPKNPREADRVFLRLSGQEEAEECENRDGFSELSPQSA